LEGGVRQSVTEWEQRSHIVSVIPSIGVRVGVRVKVRVIPYIGVRIGVRVRVGVRF
jgi:hypothetical protein